VKLRYVATPLNAGAGLNPDQYKTNCFSLLQVEILKENGNQLILHCSAGYDNSPTSELKEAG
jgi:hypothetical protein